MTSFVLRIENTIAQRFKLNCSLLLSQSSKGNFLRALLGEEQKEQRRYYSSKQRRRLQVGDYLPDVKLYEGSPDNAVSAYELYKGKRGVLFAVLGAFTPGCTNTHIPDYLSLYEKFNEEGYLISCVAVNDPFVMQAWGVSTGAAGKIRMLADPRGEFTQAVGMDLDCRQILGLGGIRSQKYSLIIEDGKIMGINVDPEHTGLACLLCIRNMKVKDVVVDSG